MDPIQALREILTNINELSGGALDLIDQLLGGGEAQSGDAPPAPEGEEAAPAPPSA